MKTYRFFIEDVKQNLYDQIKKNPYYARKLLEKLWLNKRPIPDDLWNVMLEDPIYIHPILEQMIAYADWQMLNHPIIKRIVKENENMAYELFEFLVHHHMEKLKQLTKDKNPFLYSLYKGISNDPALSKKLMQYHSLNVPEIPGIILKSINQEMATAYSYAQDRLDNGKKVPESTLKKLTESIVYSIQIALIYLKQEYRIVPEIILQAIANHKQGTMSFYKELLERKIPVPRIIIDAVDKWGGPDF